MQYYKACLLSLLFIPLMLFMSVKGVYANQLENIGSTSLGVNLKQCNAGNLAAWDWPQEVRTLPHQSGSKTPDTLFDPQKTDYLIFLSQSNAASPMGSGWGYSYRYTMYDAGTGGNAKVYEYGGNTWIKSVGTQGQPLNFYAFEITDSYSITHGTYFPYVTSTSSATGSTTPTSPVYRSLSLESASVGCVVAAHGVDYDPGYTGPKFKSNQGFTAGGTAGCSTLDIGCKLATAFQTVTTTLADFAREIFGFFVDLWIPDSTKTQAQFNDLGDFMTAKLGFLVYPFDFIGDFFGAFSGGGTWCTSASCVVHSSGALGSVDFNFLAIATGPYADVWNWFKLFIQATTVVTLMGMLISRFKEVQTK